jgi:anti-sigma-K factor RskA
MRHLDPDTTALLAIGEVAKPSDREHLAECAQCADDVSALARAAAVGRSTLSAGDLIAPDPRVWSRISEELSLAPELAPAPVVTLRPRSRLRRLQLVLAAAAAIALVFGGLATWQSLQPAPESVLATATLDALPAWPGATGRATVETSAKGDRSLHVSVDAPSPPAGFLEVWLMTSDAKRLVSLGVVSGASGTFAIPAGVDITQYVLVDISDQPYNGNPAHSGNSIVRGQLRGSA